jgi:predicted PurR-regulated permease PerM
VDQPRDTAQLIALARWLLVALVVWLAWSALSYLASVLAPILAALLIAYLLNPVVERLHRRGVSRAAGAALILATFIAIVAGVVTIAVPRIADQAVDFARDLPHMFDNLNHWLDQHFGVTIPSDWKSYLEKVDASSMADGKDIASAALGGAFSVLGAAAELLLVPVFAFYFLSDFPHLVRRIDHLIPPRQRGGVHAVIREIDNVVAGWLRGQAIVTSTLMVLYATGFTLVGMPLSLPIGLLVGLLTVVPFVGTFVGATIAMLVTLATGGGSSTMLSVAAVILCLHLLEAAVLTPKIVGHRVGLSESGALFAVVAGGKLLGFVGIVLAVPIAATCAVLARLAMRYYEHTSFFGHESDADVVITPAMATIWPGALPGSKIARPPTVEDSTAGTVVSAEESLDPYDWAIEPELGAAGRPVTEGEGDEAE